MILRFKRLILSLVMAAIPPSAAQVTAANLPDPRVSDGSAIERQQQAGAEDARIKVLYSSPYEDVEIDGTKVIYRVRKMKFARIIDDTPTKILTITRETTVSPDKIAQLLSFMHSTKIFELKDEYGVDKRMRHYPYEIRISDGKEDKRVIYRSGPEAEKCPPDFTSVEQRLVEFARAVTQATD